MKNYTYHAPNSEYTLCTQLCLSAVSGKTVTEMRKVWGREAPIVKCCGEVFLMPHDAFKTLSGHYVGKAIGEPDDYWM